MKNKICIMVGLITIVAFSFVSCSFAPGSYPYAEVYEFHNKESDLIAAIEKFKENNPEYCVPMESQLSDGRRDDNDLWYHFYFYYKGENKIIYTWVRQKDRETTSFAFVRIKDGLELGNWKDINKDFSRKENKLLKEEFEQCILNKIREQMK